MNSRAAFLDIGTNTILCLIAELRDAGRFTVLADLAEITRLGRGVDQTGRISPEGERRSLEVLRCYLDCCRNLGVEQIHAVGTSALRDARNSADVRARFKKALDLDVQVLSGEEEAACSFLAVQRGLRLSEKELLVIDIGGGSTEFIWGNESGIRRATSINIGSVRLTERYLHSDPVGDDECNSMVMAIDGELGTLWDGWLKDAPSLTVVGIAGTFTTLAAVEKKLIHYSHNEVHGSWLSLAEVRRQLALYRGKTIAERKKIAGLEPKRADVILSGACLIERIMRLLRVERLWVSDQGVRYGLLYERLLPTNSC